MKPRLVRALSRLLFIGALTALFTFGRRPLPDAPPKLKKSEATSVAPPVPYADTAGIAALLGRIAQDPEGAKLVDLARKSGTRIINKKLEGNFGLHLSRYNRIEMHTALDPLTREIVLVHELRHAWQNLRLNYTRGLDRMRPQDAYAVRQFVEADARAFSALYWARRCLRENTPLRWHSTLRTEHALATEALAMMKAGRLDAEKIFRRAMALNSAPAYRYAATHHRRAQDITAGIEAATARADSLRDRWETGAALEAARHAVALFETPPDTAYVRKLLQRMGGATADVAAVLPHDYNTLAGRFPFVTNTPDHLNAVQMNAVAQAMDDFNAAGKKAQAALEESRRRIWQPFLTLR